jgi:hypothetical protein
MRNAAIILFSAAVLLGAPAVAEDNAATPPNKLDAQACLAKANHNDSDLPLQTKNTRQQLINDPSQIAAVVAAASAANLTTRGEIELGIVRALEYLKCVDQAGYQALAAYLQANPQNPIVADINQASNALAQVGGAPGGGPGGGGGGGGGGGSFSAGGGAPVASSPLR